MTKDTAGSAPASGASPQKQALLEAFDTVLKKQAEEREAEQREAARRRHRKRVRPTIWAAATFTMFLCAYLYVERPDWLFPASTPPESVAIQEASLRIGMANAAQHIERYRQRTGNLPSTLVDAGTQAKGIAYEPIDSAEWRLVGTNGGLELTLASHDPLSRFIGNSFEVISRRSR